MPSGAALNADGQAKLANLRSGSVGGTSPTQFVQPPPPLPDDVKKRFPSLHKWQNDLENWTQNLSTTIRGTTGP